MDKSNQATAPPKQLDFSDTFEPGILQPSATPTIGFEDDFSAMSMPSPGPSTSSMTTDLPPSYAECTVDVPRPYSEEEIQEILTAHCTRNCFYSRGAIKDMRFIEISPCHAFRYVLDTFIETRILENKSEPYRNQYIDGAQNGGPVPGTWSIEAKPKKQFAKGIMNMDLPRSASVQACSKCHSTGYTACNHCNGLGFSRCVCCTGTGRQLSVNEIGTTTINELETCSSCIGMGRNSCTGCQLGRIQCRHCQGHKFMKTWQSLVVKWTVESKVYETPRGELTPRHMRKAKSGAKLTETFSTPKDPKPLNCTLDGNIISASKTFISAQMVSLRENSKILQFRQRIDVIPVQKVVYEYKDRRDNFFVYGSTRLVYFLNGYPAFSCSCRCCTII